MEKYAKSGCWEKDGEREVFMEMIARKGFVERPLFEWWRRYATSFLEEYGEKKVFVKKIAWKC